MLYTKEELKAKGFFPKTKYNWGAAFPKGFNLPKQITHDDFKKIPLYVKVRYEYYATEGIHKLNH